MASNTEIANISLIHLGVTKEIANLDTENSAEAIAIRRVYDTAVNTFQRSFPYAFSEKRVTLGLVTEDPNDDWKYEYTYPSDCQLANRIVSGIRNENKQSLVPFKIVRGTSSKVIHTDCQDAILEYQVIETDEGRYEQDFIMGFSFLLAYLTSKALTGGDPFGLGRQAKEDYVEFTSIAQSNSLNEQREEEIPDAEWIRAHLGQIDTKDAQDWVAFPINFRVS